MRIVPRAQPVDALSAMLDRQREAFLRDGPPNLERRRADLAKLRLAIKDSADRIADVISADFGNRSRHESRSPKCLRPAPQFAIPCGTWHVGCDRSVSRSASSSSEGGRKSCFS